jgi:hypothetical protein
VVDRCDAARDQGRESRGAENVHRVEIDDQPVGVVDDDSPKEHQPQVSNSGTPHFACEI